MEKQSAASCPVRGGKMMVLSGHNFLQDSKVIFVEKAPGTSLTDGPGHACRLGRRGSVPRGGAQPLAGSVCAGQREQTLWLCRGSRPAAGCLWPLTLCPGRTDVCFLALSSPRSRPLHGLSWAVPFCSAWTRASRHSGPQPPWWQVCGRRAAVVGGGPALGREASPRPLASFWPRSWCRPGM